MAYARRFALALAALVVVLMAAEPALANAAITELPGDPSGSAQCGADTLNWKFVRSNVPGVSGSAMLDATAPDGSVLLHLSQALQVGAAMRLRWCGDLLGDGSQVLVYDLFSGGAHCCFSATVVRLVPGAPHLLDVELGNGGLGMPQQLTPDGAMQIAGGSDVFAYFDDLPFAASPFMPLIFAYDGEQYVEATRQFPDLLRDEVARLEADLPNVVARPAPTQLSPRFQYQEQESLALHLYGLHVLLGDADTALPDLERRVSPPVAAWLETNAPAAAEAIDAAYAQ